MVETKTIYCTIHGYTNWEKPLIDIINTPEFQRLKNIRQLAAVHHVFPCAVHTRFEHSLGVGFLAEKCGRTLTINQPELSCDIFALKLAGLCHDLGHGPLSHTFDRFLESCNEKLCHHEERSVSILKIIIKKYNILIPKESVDIACELISPVKHNLPQYMYQIIANDVDGVDVDKLDYLQRDSVYAGIGYNIDISRFFQYARVINNRLCYSFKSMQYTIHHLFMVRHQLHAQVYQHPVVRAFEYMYIDFLKIIERSIYFDGNIESFVKITDVIFNDFFVEYLFQQNRITNHERIKALEILYKIKCRKIYHCIEEYRIDNVVCEKLNNSLLSASHIIYDIVRIGYKENPLFRINFFGKNDTIVTLEKDSTSHVFPLNTEDCLLRVYTK